MNKVWVLHHPFSRAFDAREHVLIIKTLKSRPFIHSLVHRRSSQSSVAGVSFSQKLPKYEAIFYCLVKRTFTKKFKTLWSRCRKDECADRSCLCGILFSLYLHYSSPWWVLKLKALKPRAVELIYKAKTLTCKMIFYFFLNLDICSIFSLDVVPWRISSLIDSDSLFVFFPFFPVKLWLCFYLPNFVFKSKFSSSERLSLFI